jgi:hypothetical protein
MPGPDGPDGLPRAPCAPEPNLDCDQAPVRVEGNQIDLPFRGSVAGRQDPPLVSRQPVRDSAFRGAPQLMTRIGHGSVVAGLEDGLVNQG